ncbi:MAG: mechanosensitive ion channel [Planctomycetes bacterium]|nr:mechanosensitive ion channel [Planctomycetota bacterium]
MTPTAVLTSGASASAGATNGLGLPARLTLADVLRALVFALLTAVAAKNLPALLELAVLQRLPFDGGARYAVSTIARYLILLVGLSAVSGALGVGWKEIQWLAAALTFGLAFGLQEIFANFVSGLIILVERPIRVGDIVTVGGIEGRVTELRMRSTTILDWDRRELLVPNKEFITGSVINWTLTDPVTRVIIPVGVAYGSDTAETKRRLLAIAKAMPLVLADPPPHVLFKRFGDSSLDFELRVYIGSRDYWVDVVDRLHTEIDRSFRQAGIEIAFPQRDLHLRSVDPGVGAALRGEPRA